MSIGLSLLSIVSMLFFTIFQSSGLNAAQTIFYFKEYKQDKSLRNSHKLPSLK